MVGMGSLSQIMALLALRISTHNLMSPNGLGVTTTGLTHSVGPLTFSIISFSRSSLTLAVICPLRKKVLVAFCE